MKIVWGIRRVTVNTEGMFLFEKRKIPVSSAWSVLVRHPSNFCLRPTSMGPLSLTL
jgi:hypothetical protein